MSTVDIASKIRKVASNPKAMETPAITAFGEALAQAPPGIIEIEGDGMRLKARAAGTAGCSIDIDADANSVFFELCAFLLNYAETKRDMEAHRKTIMVMSADNAALARESLLTKAKLVKAEATIAALQSAETQVVSKVNLSRESARAIKKAAYHLKSYLTACQDKSFQANYPASKSALAELPSILGEMEQI